MSVKPAINFKSQFGNQAAVSTAKEDKPKAEFWLNIGYPVEVGKGKDKETRFVSLPMGIPLDTQEHLPTNQRNVEFAAFQSARNGLLDQILEHAQKLNSGEDCVLNLQIQLRRVNEELEDIDPTAPNPFAMALQL